MNEVNNNLITIRVWGDFACFTRPEMKAERVSYPICNPSAARGILEAIYWEPQMYYIIDSISVIKKGRWFSFRRNEITSVINLNQAQSWILGKTPIKHISAGGGADDAAQRNMLALADVEYLITAEVRSTKLHDASRFNLKKYTDEIKRRALKGKCYHRPALGCREFAADFDWVDEKQAIKLVSWEEEDLGLMLYDVFDVEKRSEGFRWFTPEENEQARSTRNAALEKLPRSKHKATDKEPLQLFEGEIITPQAAFFHAQIKDAQMDCHPERVALIRPKGKEAD